MKKTIVLFLMLNILLIQQGFSFGLFKNSDFEIRSFLNKYQKAMSSNDTELIKSFYASDYISSDGYNLEDLGKMLDKTHNSYDNLKYKSKINSINAYENWALIQMSDKTSAIVYPTDDKKIKKEKQGVLDGKSVYVVYLRKDNDGWKIIKDDVLMEETSLKYGIARKIDMDLITPATIKNGQEYDLSLRMDTPNDIVALASISREEITYPPAEYDEKFRRMPESGDLERLVKANNKNIDEYAIASVGFTKVSLNEEQTKAKIEVLGMAYLMKRVNMEHIKALKIKEVENN